MSIRPSVAEIEEWLEAAVKGDLASIKRMHSKGMPIESRHPKDDFGLTAIHWAAVNGHIPVMEFLIAKGAKTEGDVGNILDRTIEKDQLPAFEWLLASGVDFNESDCNGYTPLMRAISLGRNGHIKTLLKRGVTFKKKVPHNGSYLHLAVNSGNTETIQLLLDSGVPSNVVDRRGRSPFVSACEKGQLPVVKFFLQTGKIGREEIDQGLFAAAWGKGFEVSAFLLENDADPTWKEPDSGMTSLAGAAVFGKTELVKLLLASGQFKPHTKPVIQALAGAKETEKKEAVELLTKFSPPKTKAKAKK